MDSFRSSIKKISKPKGLLESSYSYKPFRYPWAYDFWKRQQQVHWMPEEVPLGEDCKDWVIKLNDGERNLLTQIFRFFTQSDVEVNDNYMENYSRVFKPTEVKMMLAAFSNIETVHIAAYALLLDYMQKFNVDSDHEIAKTLAMFGGFTEGLQLFASFAMLLNFPRHNKMRGMGQIITWSVRDESLHCECIVKLFHEFVKETKCMNNKLKDEIVECCRKVVSLEDNFIDLAFEMGPVEGMEPIDIKNYIRYIADWRLKQLNLPILFNVKKHPLPWLTEILNGVEHANFFEARATEYSKVATSGNWDGKDGVWSLFDKKIKSFNQ